MKVQIDIAFNQLLNIIKTLPAGRLNQLKNEIQKEAKNKKSEFDLETLLLNKLTAIKKHLEVIVNNRKAIN